MASFNFTGLDDIISTLGSMASDIDEKEEILLSAMEEWNEADKQLSELK